MKIKYSPTALSDEYNINLRRNNLESICFSLGSWVLWSSVHFSYQNIHKPRAEITRICRIKKDIQGIFTLPAKGEDLFLVFLFFPKRFFNFYPKNFLKPLSDRLRKKELYRNSKIAWNIQCGLWYPSPLCFWNNRLLLRNYDT